MIVVTEKVMREADGPVEMSFGWKSVRTGVLLESRTGEPLRSPMNTSGIEGDKIWRKRTPSFPGHESIVPRNAQKQRCVGSERSTLCASANEKFGTLVDNTPQKL